MKKHQRLEHIKNVELDRDDVIIKGAEYKLKKVASVRALVDVDEFVNAKAGDMILKDVPLVAYDTDGNVIDVEIVPKSVDANVTITSPSKEVPIRVVPKGNLAFGKAIKTLTPSISTIKVYGDEKTIEDIEYIPVTIDVKGLDSDKDFNVTIKKPTGITELSQNTINIKVGVDDSKTQEFNNISVATENLNEKYKVQALSENDSRVTVVVKGSQDILSSIDASTIKAYINLEKYGVGEHEVPVKVTGSDVRLSYSSKTKKVKVRITEK